MKKILFFGLALCLGIYSNAQKQAQIPVNLLNKSEKMMKVLNGAELPIMLNELNPYVKTKPAKDLGTQLGITWYDLQSNSNVGNRMMVYPDGTIAAVWTMATESAWTSRGTGHNRSTDGGNTWKAYPNSRLENVKTGWPNIGKLANGTEVDAVHSATQGLLSTSTNNGNTWTPGPIGDATLGLTWPRMVTNGNTIHVIGTTNTVNTYQGFTSGALVYMKSTDNGVNWTAPVIPTGLDITNYPTHRDANGTFSDEYAFAANGNTLAIVVGSAYTTPALVKSTNNGDTWSYTEILHLPIKRFEPDGSVIFDMNGDGQQDNHYSDDGTNFVAIDQYGTCHVFFGRMRYTSDGSGASYFAATDGLYYWNEYMGTIYYQYKWTDINGVNTYEGIPDTVNFPIITGIVDINGNGVIDLPDNGSNDPFGQYFNSLSSQPNAVIAPDGTLTLFYSSIVEGTDGTVGSEHKAFRNVWEIHKSLSDPAFTWSTPIRIAEDDFTEEVWPCVSPVTTMTGANFKAHLWYQGDGYPGNSLQPNSGNSHPVVENAIYYVGYSAGIVGIKESNITKSEPLVYPNPASQNVTISYNLVKAGNVKLSIYNMVGQQMMTTNKTLAAGDVKVSLNIETLSHGIYFIKSTIGNETFTNKLVIE